MPPIATLPRSRRDQTAGARRIPTRVVNGRDIGIRSARPVAL